MKRLSPNSVSRLLLAGCLVLSVPALIGTARGEPRGLVIYKDNAALPDGTAKVFEYAAFEDLGQIKRFTSDAGKRLDLNPFQPNVPVPYPAPPATRIVGPDQLPSVAAEIAQYDRMMARYPNSKPLLTPKLEVAREIQRRVKGGEYFYKGDWLSAAEYQAIAREQLDRLQSDVDRRNEKRKLEEEDKRRSELEAARRKR